MDTPLRTFRPAPAGFGERNATLGTYASQYGDYVEFYRAGATCLVRDALASRAPVDSLIYPVVYMYRHALELALKDAIAWVESSIDVRLDAGFPVETDPNHEILRSHDLKWLAARLKTRAAFLDGIRELDPHVERLANEAHLFDAGGERVRYPFLSKGNPSWPEQAVFPILVDIAAVQSDFTYALNWLSEFSSDVLDDVLGWMELVGTKREWEAQEASIRANADVTVQRARDEWGAWAARTLAESRAEMPVDPWYRIAEDLLAEISVETLIDDDPPDRVDLGPGSRRH